MRVYVYTIYSRAFEVINPMLLLGIDVHRRGYTASVLESLLLHRLAEIYARVVYDSQK